MGLSYMRVDVCRCPWPESLLLDSSIPSKSQELVSEALKADIHDEVPNHPHAGPGAAGAHDDWQGQTILTFSADSRTDK